MELKEYDIGGVDILLEPCPLSPKEAVNLRDVYYNQISERASEIEKDLGQDPVSGKEPEDPTENKQLTYWNSISHEILRLAENWEQLDPNEKIDINPLRLLMIQNGLVDFTLLEELMEHNSEQDSGPSPLVDMHDLINLLREISSY